ncbi:hypothetical protein NDU88_011580 [Pleurodeles waltl]|uniref:Uncharacterized protein n=1 Tax=Pleurodeles waltl TaxID=8319 RepID=A0AAV7S6M9_PLEWA|nr:hypothetical protein NDU88_011580 [Pleurodeles waltl]
MMLVALEQKGASQTLWVLPERKEEIQLRALSCNPALWRRESCLGAVVASKAGLGGVQDGVVLEVVGELCVDDLLDDLRREGEEGDRAEVFEVVGVCLGFLEEGVDFGVLPAVREGCGIEG